MGTLRRMGELLSPAIYQPRRLLASNCDGKCANERIKRLGRGIHLPGIGEATIAASGGFAATVHSRNLFMVC